MIVFINTESMYSHDQNGGIKTFHNLEIHTHTHTHTHFRAKEIRNH